MAKTLEQFGQTIKAKYPQYNDIPDAELGTKMLSKYPQYSDMVDTSSQVPKEATKEVPIDPATGKPSTQGKLGLALLQGIANPFLRVGANVLKVGDALTGKINTQEDVEAPYDFGPLGKVKPFGVTGDLKQKLKETAGVGLEIGSNFLGGGEAGTIGKAALKTAIKEGAIIGGTYGVGQGLEENKDLAGVLQSGATGTFFGGAIGAGGNLIPKGIGKLNSSLEQKAAQKLEQASLLEKGIADSRIAKVRQEGGNIVKDLASAKAIRQGVPEADVALIRTGSEVDKAKMGKMLDIRENQLTNKSIPDRASHVVGDTYLERIKGIEAVNEKAGKSLNMVAKSLEGKKVDPSEALINFSNKLEEAGVTLDKKGNLKFKGSKYEGLTSTQNSIKNVWERAKRITKNPDALDIHRAKSFIDEIVNYGKSAEGLSGSSEYLLKSFRHDLDGVLDSKFPKYNKVNTMFSDTKGELEKIGQSVGKKFETGKKFANADLGNSLRTIFSNNKGRGDMLALLDSSNKIAQKYGVKTKGNIMVQAGFADTLEKLLGSEAPTSFLGQIERGVGGAEQAVSAGAELLQGKPIKAGLKGLKAGLDLAKGVNQKNQIKALRELLGSSVSKIGK